MGKLTDQQKIQLIEDYKNPSHNCATLARQYGVNNSSVRSLLIRRGIKLKTMSEAFRQYSIDHTFFDIIDTETKAYFLGLLYADGYNNEKRGEIHLSLQKEDKDILDLLKVEIKSTRPLLFIDLSNRGKRNQKDVYRFDISSKHISKRLNELGCMQAKTFKLNFPTSDQVPDFLIRHFIRGYFDGDGCFVSTLINQKYHQHSVGIVSTTSFCHSLNDILLKKIGITSYFSKRHMDRDDNNCNIHISGNKQVKKFMDWIYQDSSVYLKRKYLKYQDARIPD